MSKNDDMPRRESIEFFENAMKGHSKVDTLARINSQVYLLNRKDGTSVRVYVTNLYTIGIADYYDIIGRENGINAIVTLSRWNGYTEQAKIEAAKSHIGIFVVDEFMGALNSFDICRYIKYDSKGKPIRYWRYSSD